MDSGQEGAFVGLAALGHGLVLGLAEKSFDVVPFGAVGGPVLKTEILCLQGRPGIPHLPAAVGGGVVHDHHARDPAVGRQGVLQESDPILALPSVAGRPPGQGWGGVGLVVGAGGGQGRQDVHALTLGTLVGDFGAVPAAAPGVGGRQAGAETGFVEEEEVEVPGGGFF